MIDYLGAVPELVILNNNQILQLDKYGDEAVKPHALTRGIQFNAYEPNWNQVNIHEDLIKDQTNPFPFFMNEDRKF